MATRMLAGLLAVCVLSSLSFLSSQTARAATYTVCASGCDFSSLQAAQNTVASGDVLDVRGDLTEGGIVLTKDLTITSTLPQPPIIQAATAPGIATNRVFYISDTITVTMSNLILRHGVFASGGGGITNFGNLTLQQVTLEHNQAGSLGGAIFNQGANASLTVVECTIRYNAAGSRGGGIYSDSGVVDVARSTIAMNRAFEGGGILNSGTSTLTIENSTVSLNLAANGGAGILNLGGGTTTARSCTFAYNALRGIQNNGSTSTFQVQNCLIGNAYTFDFQPGGGDCAVFLGGVITDLGHNIVENPDNCVFGAVTSQTGVDVGLSALANYGGPTRTHAITGTSPAGNSGDAGALTVDQRNEPRGQGGADDVGSFEFRDAGEFVRPPAFAAAVAVSGTIHFVEFRWHDQRGPNFEVQIQSGGGFTPFTPNYFNHATYLGVVQGVPGAMAGATYFPLTGEHYYHVIFEDGTEWANEGGSTQILTGGLASAWPGLVPDVGGAGTTLWGAEIGVDLPNDRFTNAHGSDADDAAAMIEHSFLATNLAYFRQTGIQNRIGRVIIRGDAGADPYGPLTIHDEYLVELTNQWDNVLPASTHDLAMVVRAEAGGGLASIGTVGNPGYSSNDATSRGDFSRVFRHEGGHNWYLGHFDGQAPEGPTINSGNSLGKFSGPEQALMIWFRGTRTASLDALGPLSLPVPPSAATDLAFVSAQVGSEVIDLLANDHDANGEALTLVSFSTTSELTLGGTLAQGPVPGTVSYSAPVTGPTSAFDRFSYRIRDASGQEAVGLLYVRLVGFSTTYQQDFDSYANGTTDLGDGSYMLSNLEGTPPPSVQGQALQLIPDEVSRRTSYTVPLRDLEGGFFAQLDYRITASGPAADGFALNFGAPNATRIQTGGIGQFPYGLSVEWVTWDARGYHVRLDGQSLPGGFVANTGLADGVWHTAEVHWHPSTGLSLSVDGNPIFANLATDGFNPSPEYMIAFSGYTGGFSNEVLLDNVDVGPDTITDVPTADGLPRRFALDANVPNPFNPITRIRFALPAGRTVKLTVYDVRGRRVRSLVDGERYEPGFHEVLWRGVDDGGQSVASGVYMYRIEAGDFVRSRRMVLVR